MAAAPSAMAAAPSAMAAPPSPLPAYVALASSRSQLRTGYTHRFARESEADRSAAAAFRARCRSGEFAGQTSGSAPGFIQANFVALPRAHAFDFLKFCLANPRACPLLDVTEPGDPVPRCAAPSADLRTDIPRYRVWRDGTLAEERAEVGALWDADGGMVGFLLGCSFSWEQVLVDAGLPPRQIEEGSNVPMYVTTLPSATAGPFGGQLVVSMRPYRPEQIAEVARLTGGYPGAHGAPIHWGDPAALGLTTEGLATPSFGDAVTIRPGELPVFWACGVTPQSALVAAKLPLAITHAPGFMFITDLLARELREDEAAR